MRETRGLSLLAILQTSIGGGLDTLPSFFAWRELTQAAISSLPRAAVAVDIEAELAGANAKEPEADELGAPGAPCARSFPLLADRSAVRALGRRKALIEDNVAERAAWSSSLIAAPKREGRPQKHTARGFDDVGHSGLT